eukprot:363275-Chlamydomonas_euryale.AAC.8
MLRYDHPCALLPRAGVLNRAACYRWPAVVTAPAPARPVVMASARLVVYCSSGSSPDGSSSGFNSDGSSSTSTAPLSDSQVHSGVHACIHAIEHTSKMGQCSDMLQWWSVTPTILRIKTQIV